MFRYNPLYGTDGYKPGHKAMLAPGTTRLYGTWIPRSLKRAPPGVKKIMSFGHQMTWIEIHGVFQDFFFNLDKTQAMQFPIDMALYLGIPYDGQHFDDLYELGFLPLIVQALPEGIETLPNIPHETFLSTKRDYAWLTLYMETIISNLAWKSTTSATTAKQYRRNAEEWVKKTDPDNLWLVDYMCHDFSSRGLNGPWDQLSVGLGHATSFRGSDTLITIPAARYYYGEPQNEVIINSVNASEHSVTCTGIFYYQRKLMKGQLQTEIEHYYSFDVPCEGSVEKPDYLAIAEYLNLRDWLAKFPEGILSVVSDTFDLWKLITFILPRLKSQIMARKGKLVIRPDSGDPVDITCGINTNQEFIIDELAGDSYMSTDNPSYKGVIELLWDIFGGTTNTNGYKVLDSHIGAIYGDSITIDRQLDIYMRLASKQFAATNIVLGIGSFTYQYVTRDTLGWAAKGAWFESLLEEPCPIGECEAGIDEECDRDGCLKDPHAVGFNIYKDPITDDGTKKSLKGFQFVYQDDEGEYRVEGEVDERKAYSKENILQVIYRDGKFENATTFTEIRERIKAL